MTAILVLAGVVSGFVTGWVIRTISVLAQVSWSQERMQRKVTYWQDQALLARDAVDQLIRQAAAGRRPDQPPPGPRPADPGSEAVP